MTAFSGTGYRYRIVLSGECGPLVAALFADVTIESARGRTCITACVQDDSGLYGLIHRFEDLALHLISLGELDVAEAADTLGLSPGPVATHHSCRCVTRGHPPVDAEAVITNVIDAGQRTGEHGDDGIWSGAPD
jgi:hypothetical protein